MSKWNWSELIAEYKTSGLSQSAFSRRKGLTLSALNKNLKMAREAGSFVQIQLDNLIELELQSGVRLRVSQNNLASVLKALQS